MRARLTAAIVFGMVPALLGGCDDSGRGTSAVPAPVAAPADDFRLPVSLNAVMVALVNQAADPIWLAAWRNPRTEKEWRDLERMAYQLELAGALLVIPGNGPMDATWTANPQWTAWAGRLEAAGGRAVKAIEARDVEAISRVGDEIVDVCEGCHIAFKPDLPTSGMFGDLSPTASDFDDSPSDADHAPSDVNDAP
ncbi:MAG: hypothetical protein PVH91_01975 [Pseudomonadales bacterium]|jgi:hypothetical protein